MNLGCRPINRTIYRLVILAISLWLGWEVARNAVADYYADSDPSRSLAWVSEHADALVELGEAKLASGADLDAVNNAAHLALQENPLQSEALVQMALVSEARHDEPRALSLMLLAEERSLQDPKVEGWLADKRLRAGDYQGAVSSLDALLRVRPRLLSSVFPVLSGMASDADAAKALILVLQANPPWRSSFLTTLSRQATNPDDLNELFIGLRSASTPPTADELRAYLARLVELGHFASAYAIWADFLPPEQISMLGNVNNGDFEFPIGGLPFDWVFENVRGAQSDIAPAGPGGNALRVQFHNTRVPFRHVSQLLLLPPGGYRFSGAVQSVDLRNERGVHWTLSCAGGKGELLGETERVAGTRRWTDFELEFNVPSGPDCQAQVLRLVLAARIPSEQKAAGQIWYDNLKIVRAAEAGRL